MAQPPAAGHGPRRPCGVDGGGAIICQTANMNAPPIKNVGRHLCVPPLVGSCHFPQADWFRCVGRGLAPAAGRGEDCAPMHRTTVPGTARRPPSATRDGVGTAALRLRRGDCAICGWRSGTIGDFAPCAAREFRPLRRAGISPRARGDQRLCLWKPRAFEKARPKLLSLGAYSAGSSLPRRRYMVFFTARRIF